jgi:polysaccharide deacetylase family protein (PEP-CTERM system associated)
VDLEFGRGDVVKDTHWLLGLFARFKVSATFFCVGEVARAHPRLLREIAAAGHDIGFHGESHCFLNTLTPGQFARELQRSVPFLEDLVQRTVSGYRAPFFSLTPKTSWALDVLAEAGIRYDGSIYPSWHDRYGWPGAPRLPSRYRDTPLMLFPVPLLHPLVPIGFSGGGYLRLLPWRVIRWGTRHHRAKGRPGMIYVHPWEVSTRPPVWPGHSLGREWTHLPRWRELPQRLLWMIESEHQRCQPMRQVLEAQTRLPTWTPQPRLP